VYQNDFLGQPLLLPDSDIIAEEDSLGCQKLHQRRDDLVPHRLQPGGEELRHDPAIVFVHHQGREAVPLTVNQSPRVGIDVLASEGGIGKAVPPGRVRRAASAR